MKIAVAGGTGTVGAHIVDSLRTRGHEPVVLARSTGIDLLDGAGLAAALDGVEVVIDASGTSARSAAESIAFFSRTTTTLLAAETAAGIGHHVALSIVSMERSPNPYYAGKLAQEALIEQSPVPWTILRATQFHEFAKQMFATAKVGPLHVAPRMRTQPIAAREVGEHLVTLALAPPSGRATELAGPRIEELADMVRAYARAIGSRAWIPRVSLPGDTAHALRDGSLLPEGAAILGEQTFSEWLAEVAPGS